MISKHKYNTLFVALSKVGSSSIRAVLEKLKVFYHPDEYVPTYVSHKHLQHLNAQEYRQMLGEEDFERRFKFAIVKNPWALLVSNYLGLCRNWRNPIVPKEGLFDPKTFQKWVAENAFNKDYFDNLLCPRFDDSNNPLHYTKSPRYKSRDWSQLPGARCLHHRYTYDSQLSWITDEDGKVAVDFIGRFENLNEDFRTILNKINDIHPLPGDKSLWDLQKKNSSSRGKHYSWYYNDETVERVREHYKVDIEEFDYEFEGE